MTREALAGAVALGTLALACAQAPAFMAVAVVRLVSSTGSCLPRCCFWRWAWAAPLALSPEAAQAGAFLLPDGATGAVLATHVFLESLHYLAWIVAIPLTTAALPWTLRRVPLATRAPGWRGALTVGLGVGAMLVAVLWVAFAIDYETTREVYFTLAIAHVLAEVPFLVRLS